MQKLLSPVVEDYLKAIYHLRSEGACGDGPVTTQALAQRMGVAPPSATSMVKKLATLKLVRHTRYRGVELTEAGEKIALEIIRHHRLIETYLSQVLGLHWDEVHEEAERWEHVISEQVEARIAEVLNHPTRDPHGAPIPTLEGHIALDECLPLSGVAAGSRVTVRRVLDENSDLLRHLGEVGLVPDAEVEVQRAEPAEGVLRISVNGVPRIVGHSPAHAVLVSMGAPNSHPAPDSSPDPKNGNCGNNGAIRQGKS